MSFSWLLHRRQVIYLHFCIIIYTLKCISFTDVFSGMLHASDCGSAHCCVCMVNGTSAMTCSMFTH